MAKAAKDVAIAALPNGGLTRKVLLRRASLVVEKGKRALAKKDMRRVAEADRELSRFRKLVAEATRDCKAVNEIGEPWINLVCDAGAELTRMGEAGERQTRGGDRKSNSRGVSLIPDLSDMGLTHMRSARWQLGGSLPKEVRHELIEQGKLIPDHILTLEEILTAAKHRRREQQKVDEVEPTTATIARAACLDWLPKQPDCDLLLTDPLYSTDVEDIKAFAGEWLRVALGKVKRTGRAYVCIGAYEKELRAYLNIAPPKHLVAPQVLVWTYRNTIGVSPTHNYKMNWQAILYYHGVDAPPLDCPLMIEQFTVLDINAPDSRLGDRWHTWQKPDELCERFVRHSSKPGDLVLDPFAGSGSFILAAARLGRIAHGCDIDPKMVALAKTRGCRRERTGGHGVGKKGL